MLEFYYVRMVQSFVQSDLVGQSQASSVRLKLIFHNDFSG
jgi:hypothetical protein